MSSAIPFRPRSVSELVDGAFQIVRGSFSQLALLATVIAIPSLLIGLVNRSLMPALAGGQLTPEDISGQAFLWIVPLGVVGMCWLFVGIGALVAATSDAYLGRRVDPAGALRRSFSRAGTLIGSNLLAYLLVMIAFIGLGVVAAIVIPLLARAGSTAIGGLLGFAAVIGAVVLGLSVMARYFVITPVVMLEQAGVTASLRRSSLLTSGGRMRIVGLMTLLFVLIVVMLTTIFAVAGRLFGNPYTTSAIATIFWIPIYPLGAALVTLLYYDLRIRKEGYDIELMAGDLGAPAGQPAF